MERKHVIKFLLTLLVFLLPLAFVLGHLEWGMRNAYNTYSIKRSLLEQQKDSVQVLVMGDSHAMNDVDPKYFSAYGLNMANSSQSLYYDKRIVLKYVDQCPRLKLVILNISYFTLFSQLAHTKESWRDSYYHHFWDIDYKNLSYTDLNNWSVVSLYGFKASLNAARNKFHLNDVPTVATNGFIALPFSQGEYFTAAYGHERIAIHHELMDSSFLAENVNDLKDLIQILKNKNIRVALITTPVNVNYYTLCKPEFYNLMTGTIASLSNELGCNYHNYFKDDRFVQDDFYDTDHLNPTGVKKFSELVNQEIILQELK